MQPRNVIASKKFVNENEWYDSLLSQFLKMIDKTVFVCFSSGWFLLRLFLLFLCCSPLVKWCNNENPWTGWFYIYLHRAQFTDKREQLIFKFISIWMREKKRFFLLVLCALTSSLASRDRQSRFAFIRKQICNCAVTIKIEANKIMHNEIKY